MGEAWREALERGEHPLFARQLAIMAALRRKEEESIRAMFGWPLATEAIAECYR